MVSFHINIKADITEFDGWEPEKVAALFGGIGKVLAVKNQIENAQRGMNLVPLSVLTNPAPAGSR